MNIGDIVVIPDVECTARRFKIIEKQFSERKDVNEYKAVEEESGEVIPFDGRIRRSNFIIPLEKYKKIPDKNSFLIAQIGDENKTAYYKLVDGKLEVGAKKCTFENQRYGAEFYHRCITEILNDKGDRINPSVFWGTLAKHCQGMTLDEIYQYIQDNDIEVFLDSPSYEEAIRDLIVTINRPEVTRVENEDGKRGFNVIRVEVLLKRYAYPEILRNIEKYKREIMDIVLESISEAPEFQKLNVPVEYLMPINMIKLSADDLMFDFKLPE